MSLPMLPGGDPQPRDYPLATLDASHRPQALASQIDIAPVAFVARERKTFDASQTLEGLPAVEQSAHLPMLPTAVRRRPGRGMWLTLIAAVVVSGLLGGWAAVTLIARPVTGNAGQAAAAESLAAPGGEALTMPASDAPRHSAPLAAAGDASPTLLTVAATDDHDTAAGLARAAIAMERAIEVPATPRAAVSSATKKTKKPAPEARETKPRAVETQRDEPGELTATATPDTAEAPTLEDAFGGLTTGSEAAERRALARRRSSKTEATSAAAAAEDADTLSRAEITAAIRGVYGKVRACEANADASGKLVVKFDVLGNGRVRNARVASREFFDSKVGACVANVLEGMTLRDTGAASPRTVTYPFHIAAK